MKVLMLGWEFPPYKSGGLGTACHGLTKGLAQQGVDVTFVMPHIEGSMKTEFVNLVGTKGFMKIRKIDSCLTPYMSSESYDGVLHHMRHIRILERPGMRPIYGKNLHEEVFNFTRAARKIAEEEPHDVIHAHDWMTYQAGIEAREISGKPFVAHIHATEFDRTGGNPNMHISHLEHTGLTAADIIIANSEYTKGNIMQHYGIDPDKIKVVHFGIDPDNVKTTYPRSPMSKTDKVVLFLGRVTIQKGPDYFIEAAANVLRYKKNVRFIVAGSGDMLPKIIERAAELGIADKVTFTGFLEGDEVNKAFQMADLYVMPSVSEPYGLVALEALKNKTPIIISKQSGVSEVLNHALKVDFWDINEMTNKIVSVLNYQELFEELKDNGSSEVESFTLEEPAKKTMAIYHDALQRMMQTGNNAGGRPW